MSTKITLLSSHDSRDGCANSSAACIALCSNNNKHVCKGKTNKPKANPFRISLCSSFLIPLSCLSAIPNPTDV